MLDSIGDFLSTDFGLVATLTTIVGLTMSSLGNKMQEAMYSKVQNAQEQLLLSNKLKRKKVDLQNQIIAKKTALLEKLASSEDKEQLKTEITKAKLARGEITTAQAQAEAARIAAESTKDEATLKQEIADAELELKNTEMELSSINQTTASS